CALRWWARDRGPAPGPARAVPPRRASRVSISWPGPPAAAGPGSAPRASISHLAAADLAEGLGRVARLLELRDVGQADDAGQAPVAAEAHDARLAVLGHQLERDLD